jgi:hypothetical protein
MSLVVADRVVASPPPRAIHLVPLAVSGALIPVELVGVSAHVARVRA